MSASTSSNVPTGNNDGIHQLRISTERCAGRSMASKNGFSAPLYLTMPRGKTAYATSDGDGDFGTLHCSALFDFSVARRWRFARIFARTLIQTWASIRSSMGSRGFGMRDTMAFDQCRIEQDNSRTHADIPGAHAAVAVCRVASVTSPRMTRPAHRSQSMIDSTRRRPMMVPSSNCAQFPEP